MIGGPPRLPGLSRPGAADLPVRPQADSQEGGRHDLSVLQSDAAGGVPAVGGVNGTIIDAAEALYPAPDRWQNEQALLNILHYCERQRITDISWQTDSRILGKRDGKYRPITSRRVNATDMNVLFNLIYRGGRLKPGEYLRTSYDFFGEDGEPRRHRVTITRTAGRTEGYSFTFRAMPRTPASWHDLKLERDLVNAFSSMKYGSALVAGKNESGKSWFQAAIMRVWAENSQFPDKVIYIGSPCEFLFDDLPSGDHIVPIEVPRSIDTYDLAMMAAKSMTPNRIVLEELTGRAPMTMFIDSAVTGVAVYGTMHLSRIDDLPDAMDQYFPDVDERNSRTRALLSTLNVITVQRLEDAVDDRGKPAGRIGIREYLILEDNIRRSLLATPFEQLRRALAELVDDGTVLSRSMVQHAKELFDQGRITRETLTNIQLGIV